MMAMRMRPFVHASVVAVSLDRKSTRLNSSHVEISYAVFCLKKKKSTAWHTHPCVQTLIVTSGSGGAQREGEAKQDIFFFNETATPEIYTLSLHDALPICPRAARGWWADERIDLSARLVRRVIQN